MRSLFYHSDSTNTPTSLLEGFSLPLPPSLPPSATSRLPHPSLAALSRRRSGICYFFSEEYSVFLPITVLYLMAMGAMANRLKGTNDAFRIRNEIGYICLATAITSGRVGRRRKKGISCLVWHAAGIVFYRYLDTKKRTVPERRMASPTKRNGSVRVAPATSSIVVVSLGSGFLLSGNVHE